MSDHRVEFLVAGAQQAGAATLAALLSCHPDVQLPPGLEAHFFDAPGYDDLWDDATLERTYRACFGELRPGTLLGDATSTYLFLPEVAPRVARYNPGMKWIVLLRPPAERALAQYAVERERGSEWLPAELALLAEPLRLRRAGLDRSWGSAWRTRSYARRGAYAPQLDRVREYFAADQLLVLRHEDLMARRRAVLARVFDFLGVSWREPLPRSRPILPGGGRPTLRYAPLRAALERRARPALERLAAGHGVVFGSGGDPDWDEDGSELTGHRCILVLGSGRGGTSAVTGALQTCGVPLGEPLLPADDSNPRGYFEHVGPFQLHERLLAERGLAWHDAVAPLAGLDAVTRARWQDEMLAVWRDMAGDAPLWAFKDPRTLLFLPLWESVLRRAGVRALFLGCVRNPLDVAASYGRRDALPQEQALRIWALESATLARALPLRPSTVVSYRRLLADPYETLSVALRRLGLERLTVDRRRLAAFIAPSLDHGRRDREDPPGALAGLWRVLEQVAAGELDPVIDRGRLEGAADAAVREGWVRG